MTLLTVLPGSEPVLRESNESTSLLRLESMELFWDAVPATLLLKQPKVLLGLISPVRKVRALQL